MLIWKFADTAMTNIVAPCTYGIETGGLVHVSPHDDVIKWKHFRVTGPLWGEIHWSPVDSPHKGRWSGALVFSLICTWTNGWANNRCVGDLRHHCVRCDVTVMQNLLLMVMLHNEIINETGKRAAVTGLLRCKSHFPNVNTLLYIWLMCGWWVDGGWAG